MVPVFRRFAYRGVDLVVIPQPDGSVACIPEWMTHEQAAHIKLSSEPHFSLENLRSLRTEIDAVLVFLSSDSTKLKTGRDGIEKDPDQRVQNALQLVFSKFAEFQSARQVHVWLRDQGIELPASRTM
jgi:hypothetical protein